MRKLLICLFSLALTTIALFIGAGCSGTSNAAAIDKVLSQTHGIKRPENIDIDNLPYKDQLYWLSGEMRNIDTSKCPADFRFAYEELIRSIENACDVYMDEPKGVLDNLFSGSSFQVSKHNATERWKKAEEDVNSLAARYGAKNRLRGF